MNPIPQTIQTPCFVGDGKIDFADKQVPTPGSGQLLVQVRANALCGSERGQFYHGSGVTPGHEAAGIVATAGPGTAMPVGTPGVIFLMDFCGQCRSCREGFTNQCLAKRADMGFSHDGGYGAYELVHENIFFPVDANLPLTEATLLLDIMGTGGHAIRRAELVHGVMESLLVAGAGPIGLAVLTMAKILLGPSFPVFITDRIEYRLALAERLGGLPVSLVDTTVAEGLKRHGQSRVDVAVDTSGKSAARQVSVEALDKRGVLICVGHGEGLNLEVTRDLIAPERAVLGSEYFRFDEFVGNLALLREHRAYLSQIITHRMPVAALQQAFEVFFAGNTGKVVIEQ